MKTQFVRLIDVFILAPFLLYRGIVNKKTSLKLFFIISGVSTCVYNALNYMDKEKLTKEKKS